MSVMGSKFTFEPVLGPCFVSPISGNASERIEHSADDSGTGDDPHQPRAMPNSLLQLKGDYASVSGLVVPATPEKTFEEQDGQSDGSEYHTWQPWSLVKEWSLDEYNREVAYEEIKTILTQSLDEAGSKTFIKPIANSIAGWRPKQVSYAFL